MKAGLSWLTARPASTAAVVIVFHQVDQHEERIEEERMRIERRELFVSVITPLGLFRVTSIGMGNGRQRPCHRQIGIERQRPIMQTP